MLDFTNTTFLIPFMVDNSDRVFNLNTILKYLNANLNTNIIISEQGLIKSDIKYDLYSNLKINHILHEVTSIFHKTKLYNLGLSKIQTKNTICLDSDVLIPIHQLTISKSHLDNGIDYCFPFSENYIEISKQLSKDRSDFLQTFDFNTYLNKLVYYNSNEYNRLSKKTRHAGLIRNCPPGGCLCLTTDTYLSMGMENEDFYGYAPEDAERKHRLNVLGYSTCVVKGNLYHLDHDVSHRRISNSDGHKLYNNLIRMNKEQITEYYINKQYRKQYGV